ncbi:hypothetical protein M231_04804 [Tremella mesenterica]|uniref:Uncharacterized protein n=1 Tax=Tremella mesenterica TaxID=5217 RepID=A0A4Q1BJS3_TREME|nr:hypothetical protein M231_04804 [Tremella mesenterica]
MTTVQSVQRPLRQESQDTLVGDDSAFSSKFTTEDQKDKFFDSKVVPSTTTGTCKSKVTLTQLNTKDLDFKNSSNPGSPLSSNGAVSPGSTLASGSSMTGSPTSTINGDVEDGMQKLNDDLNKVDFSITSIPSSRQELSTSTFNRAPARTYSSCRCPGPHRY